MTCRAVGIETLAPITKPFPSKYRRGSPELLILIELGFEVFTEQERVIESLAHTDYRALVNNRVQD